MTFQDDFSSIDYTVNGPKAFFANMPLSKTLTMNLDVPDPWLVEPIIAVYVPSLIRCILITGYIFLFRHIMQKVWRLTLSSEILYTAFVAYYFCFCSHQMFQP